jgi:hypothetical protein
MMATFPVIIDEGSHFGMRADADQDRQISAPKQIFIG